MITGSFILDAFIIGGALVVAAVAVVGFCALVVGAAADRWRPW